MGDKKWTIDDRQQMEMNANKSQAFTSGEIYIYILIYKCIEIVNKIFSCIPVSVTTNEQMATFPESSENV